MTRLALVLAACSSAAPPAAPLSQHVPPAPPPRCVDTISRLASPGPELGYVVSNDTMIRHAMERKGFEFHRCARDHYTHDGRVMVMMKLKKGHPYDVRIAGIDAAMDRCICDVLFEVDFGGIDEGEIRYPFYFHM